MTDRHPIDDPELDAVPADAENEEEAGLYEHFAVTADKGQTPMRLDKFLTVRMEHCSRNRIQAAADSGNILVNGKAAKSSYKVKPLDRIQIVMPYPRREVELVAEDIPLDIPYEDQWLLLVDKPAGLVVHPGVGNYSGTLVNALMHHLNKQGIPAEEQNRAGLVHRILPASSGSPRPMRSPTRMVMPMDRPVITMVTVDMSMLPVATPETSAVAANCPTTSRSTPPYSA